MLKKGFTIRCRKVSKVMVCPQQSHIQKGEQFSVSDSCWCLSELLKEACIDLLFWLSEQGIPVIQSIQKLIKKQTTFMSVTKLQKKAMA